jgi:hypothetical protein
MPKQKKTMNLTLVIPEGESFTYRTKNVRKSSVIMVETVMFSGGSIITLKSGKVLQCDESVETVFHMMQK